MPTQALTTLTELLARLPQAGELLALANPRDSSKRLHTASLQIAWDIGRGTTEAIDTRADVYVYEPRQGSRGGHDTDIVLMTIGISAPGLAIDSQTRLTPELARRLAAHLLIAAAVAEQSIAQEGGAA